MNELILIEEVAFPTIRKMAIGASADRFLALQEEQTSSGRSVHGRLRFIKPIQAKWLELLLAELPIEKRTRPEIQKRFEAQFGFGGYRLPDLGDDPSEDLVRYWLQCELGQPKPEFSWGRELESFDAEDQSFTDWFREAKTKMPKRMSIAEAATRISDT
ncbi:MAG: hypothetical protein JST51_08305 [Armatimonadetes bacterium]|nr:hypothetical protein [Armatimonadota bacterium]